MSLKSLLNPQQQILMAIQAWPKKPPPFTPGLSRPLADTISLSGSAASPQLAAAGRRLKITPHQYQSWRRGVFFLDQIKQRQVPQMRQGNLSDSPMLSLPTAAAN